MYLLQILQIRNNPEHLKPMLFLPAATLLSAQGLASVFTSHLTSHSWFQNSMAHFCLLTHLFSQICCKVEAVTVKGKLSPQVVGHTSDRAQGTATKPHFLNSHLLLLQGRKSMLFHPGQTPQCCTGQCVHCALLLSPSDHTKVQCLKSSLMILTPEA